VAGSFEGRSEPSDTLKATHILAMWATIRLLKRKVLREVCFDKREIFQLALVTFTY
jgi:hypothetical protein